MANSFERQTWDLQADVVVVGAGGAGISAALELRDAGLSVVVLEKQPTVDDSSTSLCGGVFTFAGTDFQKKHGITDTNELLYNDLMAVGLSKNDPELVRLYVDNQLDTYYWLTGLGAIWSEIEALAGMTVPRGHLANPATLLRQMEATARQRGAKIYFETSVTGLVTGTDGRVTGVTASGKQGARSVKANRGVILATGGFGRDTKRLDAINPGLTTVVPVMGLGHHGDGHRLAQKLGASVRDMEYVKPTFGIHVNGTGLAQTCFMFYNGGIIVNKNGERYVNESISYKDLGKAALAQPGGVGYQIFDQKVFDISLGKVKEGLPPEKTLWGLDEPRKKLLVKAVTANELGDKLGLPAGALKRTVDRYNKEVEGGKDQLFGRTSLVGGVGSLIKIDVAPFYGFAAKGLLPATYGGLVVAPDMYVLNSQGKIPGLLAAGELVGGFHGASYMSGSAVVKAVIFGRVAARTIIQGG